MIWLRKFKWKWTRNGDLSKLLGTPFGLTLEIQDFDFFPWIKLGRKLSFVHLPIVKRTMMINFVFNSTF
jgi:hypothetical protein